MLIYHAPVLDVREMLLTNHHLCTRFCSTGWHVVCLKMCKCRLWLLQVVCRSLPFACNLVTLHNLTHMARLGREIRVRLSACLGSRNEEGYL